MNKKMILAVFIVFLFFSTPIYSADYIIRDCNIRKDCDLDIKSGRTDYENRYSLIILGKSTDSGDYNKFTRELQDMYNTLTEYYDFKDENIQILFREQSYNPHDSDFIDFVLSRAETYDSTDESLIERLNQTKNFVNNNDLFVFTYIGHGGCGYFNDEYKKHSYFSCFGDIVLDNYLSNHIEGLGGFKIFFIHACYAGGFIEYLAGENTIVLTGSTKTSMTFTWIDDICEGLRGQADLFENNGGGNKNGLVDFDEVFRFPSCKTYLIDDNGDGIGHNSDDKEYDTSTPGMDGYVSANTTLGEMNLVVHVSRSYSKTNSREVDFETWTIGGCGRPYDYNWDFGDGTTSDEQSPTHIYNNWGNYDVILTVIDSSGNKDIYETTVKLEKRTKINVEGMIYHENVDEKIGQVLTGSFNFENIGDSGSELDWKIDIENDEDYEITFSQTEGYNLKPSDGKVTIDCTIIVKSHSWSCIDNEIKIIDLKGGKYEEIRILLIDGESDLDTERDIIFIPSKEDKYEPGEEVIGYIFVKNENNFLSFVNWEIVSWPDWGEWSFSDLSGLTRSKDQIEVTIKLPTNRGTFDGVIKIENKNNPEDHKKVSLEINTWKAKIFHDSIFEKILFKHSILFSWFQLFQDIVCG